MAGGGDGERSGRRAAPALVASLSSRSEACNAAGLPKGTSAHGLRKAACRRLAEAGLSENVIASISGHTDMREVARYTKAANQAKMARDGMAALIEQTKKRTTSG